MQHAGALEQLGNDNRARRMLGADESDAQAKPSLKMWIHGSSLDQVAHAGVVEQIHQPRAVVLRPRCSE